MLNFGASKPRVKGGARAPGAPLDPHLNFEEKFTGLVKVEIITEWSYLTEWQVALIIFKYFVTFIFTICTQYMYFI